MVHRKRMSAAKCPFAGLIASVVLAGCNAHLGEPGERQANAAVRVRQDADSLRPRAGTSATRANRTAGEDAGQREAAQAAVGGKELLYDLAEDFSATANPNGQWSFGLFNHIYTGKPNELRNLTTYGDLVFTKSEETCGGGTLCGWGSFAAGFFGLGASATGIMKNSGGSSQFYIPAGSVAIFPEHGPVVARWTAPKGGSIFIQADFVNLTKNAGWPELWIVHNRDIANALHYEKAYSGDGTPGKPFNDVKQWANGSESHYRGTVVVATNDTVDFVVDPIYTRSVLHADHPEGDNSDIIGVDAEIRYVSENAFR
jgi:hypothetical protein